MYLSRECQQLDDLIRTLNQEQYRLLQTGRKFAEHANRLSETFHWEHTHLLEDQALRTLTEPGSRSRAREEAESRSGDFVDRREIARRQAEHLHRAIKSEQFSLPISPNKYRTEEGNFRIENEKLKTVERDLDYFAQVAYSHIEKSARFEHSLISLRRSLSEAFTQTSQVSREVSVFGPIFMYRR
jgi:type I site-specific restriction-modification system R (restriction) subunit